MAVESTTDAMQRLRLEAHTIIDNLASEDRRDLSFKAQLARLDDLSVELRRIAGKAATPDLQRDAESLAALIDDARRHFENLSA